MSAILALAARAGILPVYRDLAQQDRPTSPETAAALLAAMSLPAGSEAEAAETLAALEAEAAARPLPQWHVVQAGAPAAAPARDGAWRLITEDGRLFEGHSAGGAAALPPLPLGRHRLEMEGGTCWILSAPRRLPLPARGWGITGPLYGLREAGRAGLADYRDLAEAVRGMAAQGAGFFGVNPIHAGFPTEPGFFSPYSPSSRRRFNILHIAVGGEDVPAGDDAGALIDWRADGPRRLAALRARFHAAEPAELEALSNFRAAEGEALELFALHQALSDHFGPWWPDWPEACRSPRSPACRAFAARHAAEVSFHAWAQMIAESQLRDVAAAASDMAQGLYLDLAVGTHPAGAETWAEPDLFARGISLGAPPDDFAPQGQRWGLAPMDPRALARTGFAALAETLRLQLRFAGLLRIDHILGFERTFWVPEDLPGAYVAMPRDAMLAIARIEAARAGATIVGEDLGVVPEGLREKLAASGLLGCRLAMFDHTPGAWPEAALASFGTHDLPPYAGWLQEEDIAWHERLGHVDAAGAAALRARRAEERTRLHALTGGADVDAVHAMLGRSPARLIALQAEDVLGLADQPNLPGTIEQHPNWRRRLGIAPQDWAGAPGLSRAAAIMREAER